MSHNAALFVLLFIRTAATAVPDEDAALSIARRHIIQPRFLFNYQSHGINFAEWISLFTLCLTPLLVHVIVGVPEPVYLSRRRPHWSDRMCHFNPASILWRYFVIFDRRVRCLDWTAADMAASNAVFWTGRSWDGSEEMMIRSRKFCTRLPNESRVTFLSASAVKTLIITLQGLQVIYSLAHPKYLAISTSLSTLLTPVAAIGLLRLPAALWLSEDYSYASVELLEARAENEQELEGSTSSTRLSSSHLAAIKAPTTRLNVEALDSLDTIRFRPANGRHGIIVRICYLMPLAGFWGIGFYWIAPRSFSRVYTATTFSQGMCFFLTLFVVVSTYSYYFLRGNSTTTVIPCLNYLWYKIFTVAIYLVILILVMLAAIETRRTPCGIYTTYPMTPNPANSVDAQLCKGFDGIRTSEMAWNVQNGTMVILKGFAGFCSGKVESRAAVKGSLGM